MTEITTNVFVAALKHVCELIISSEPMLTELDSRVGDGDHGFGMKDGFTELKASLEEQEFRTIHNLACATGMVLVKSMGGASGVIFGTMFLGGHDALVAPDGSYLESIDAAAMRRYFRLGAEAIAKRGRTQPNDRTMLDALLYAVDAMEQSETDDIAELLKCGWEGACRGAEATSQMRPRLGRSKNFRDQALGWPDPGAVSTSIIFRGLYEAVASVCTES